MRPLHGHEANFRGDRERGGGVARRRRRASGRRGRGDGLALAKATLASGLFRALAAALAAETMPAVQGQPLLPKGACSETTEARATPRLLEQERGEELQKKNCYRSKKLEKRFTFFFFFRFFFCPAVRLTAGQKKTINNPHLFSSASAVASPPSSSFYQGAICFFRR